MSNANISSFEKREVGVRGGVGSYHDGHLSACRQMGVEILCKSLRIHEVDYMKESQATLSQGLLLRS